MDSIIFWSVVGGVFFSLFILGCAATLIDQGKGKELGLWIFFGLFIWGVKYLLNDY